MPVMFPQPIISAFAVAAMFTTSLLATAEERPAQDRAVIVAGRPAPALAGVWRSRGYGYILRVGADRLELFHVAGSFCYADPRKRRDPDNLFVYWRSLENGTVAFTGTLQTRYVFDRIAELPAACTAPTRWTSRQLDALVAATFAELYPSFAERGIDWAARTREIDAALSDTSTPLQLFEALRAMLAGVNDPHVEVQAKIDGDDREYNPGQAPTLLLAGADPDGAGQTRREAAWQQAYRRGVLDVVLKGRGRTGANNRVLWGRVGDIGYLNILAMERFSPDARRPTDDTVALDAALDAAMATFRDARAVIVDVSNNDGGFDKLAQRIAGRFADGTYLAYRKIAVGAQNLEPQPFEVAPSPRARFLGPVYMLTSDVTLSAAEVFALYMRALPNVVHVGKTTRGALSDTTNKPLPNGWMLVLPTEIYRTPDGTSYEARGVPPQHRFEVFPRDDLAGGHARRVNVLIDDIRRELDGK
jgi:carboxyl-terminal processing protease